VNEAPSIVGFVLLPLDHIVNPRLSSVDSIFSSEEGHMRRILLFTFFAGFLFPFLALSPASAQATRTWVSGVGDDANPCSRTAPCKTFAGAISKTAASGEINVLDPGGFGAVTITKSITIRSDHIEAGVLVSGTNGIIVNALSTDNVILEGLDIEGLGTGINGVQIIGGGIVTIIRCTIHHFTGNGVNLVGTAGARAFVVDTAISNNAGGINVAGAGGATNAAIVTRGQIDFNTAFELKVTAPSSLVLNGATVFGDSTSILNVGGATVFSFGNNAINGVGAVTSIIPLK